MLASLKDSLNVMEHYIMYSHVGWWISSHLILIHSTHSHIEIKL